MKYRDAIGIGQKVDLQTIQCPEFFPQEDSLESNDVTAKGEEGEEEEREGLSSGRSTTCSPGIDEPGFNRKRKPSFNSEGALDHTDRPKRRGTGKPVYIASHLPQGALCLVCEAIATGNHYNSVTCEGCKGFFRRSVQSGNWKLYACARAGSCNVGAKDRGSCKKCRYDKCIAKGMDKSRVLDENARKKLRKLKEHNRELRQGRERQETTTSMAPETPERSRDDRQAPINDWRRTQASDESRSIDESSRSSSWQPPSDHVIVVEELTRAFRRIGLDAKPDEASCISSDSSLDFNDIFYPSILIAAKLGSIFCHQIPGFDQICDAPRLISRGFWSWFLMRMMVTYDPTRETITLDVGQTVGRQRARSFGAFIPDKVFDLAKRLSFKMVRSTEVVATMSALTIINADIEDIRSPTTVMLLEDRLLAGIYDHLSESADDDVENMYNRFVDILTDLRRLGKDYCNQIAASKLASLTNDNEAIVLLPGM